MYFYEKCGFKVSRVHSTRKFACHVCEIILCHFKVITKIKNILYAIQGNIVLRGVPNWLIFSVTCISRTDREKITKQLFIQCSFFWQSTQNGYLKNILP